MISASTALILAMAPAAAGPRYPADLALDPTQRLILTANEESSSVTLLDRESGSVLDELELAAGGRPHAIALGTDGSGGLVAVVAETYVHSLAVLAVEDRRLKLVRRLPTGRRPMDVALRSFSSQALAACEGEGELWVHATDGSAPPRRLPVLEGVRHVLVLDTFDLSGRTPLLGLAAVAGRTEVAVINISTGSILGRHKLADGTARNAGGLAYTDRTLWVAHQVQATEAPIEPQTIEWGLILANRVTKLSIDEVMSKGGRPAREWTYPLDDNGHSAGDPGRMAAGAGGALLVPSGGTDRILFLSRRENAKYDYRYLSPTLTSYTPTPSLRVGDRPVAVRVTHDGERAYVACSLDDTVVEVDVEARKVLRTLRLGPPPEDTAEHRGARIFFDANRSRDGWYSCHSCHPDGGTAGHNFNTRSDGRGLAKRSPPLFGADRTGPWAWLGKFESLEAQVAASLHKTMAVDRAPSVSDVEDVIAYLRTFRRPLPVREGEDLGGDPVQGAKLFESAGCSECHAAPEYTSPNLRDVGLEAAFDGVQRYNPPSLIGVRDRFRHLHDGRAASLEAVFREHNPRGLHGRASELGDGELRDLMAFLKTL